MERAESAVKVHTSWAAGRATILPVRSTTSVALAELTITAAVSIFRPIRTVGSLPGRRVGSGTVGVRSPTRHAVSAVKAVNAVSANLRR